MTGTGHKTSSDSDNGAERFSTSYVSPVIEDVNLAVGSGVLNSMITRGGDTIDVTGDNFGGPLPAAWQSIGTMVLRNEVSGGSMKWTLTSSEVSFI